jgi:hypothetical protein
MPQFNSFAPKLITCYGGVLKLNWFKQSYLPLFITPSARNPQKHSSSVVAWIRFRGNLLTKLFHRNGCTRHISYRDNSHIVACGHYLVTAVSLAPQFFLWTNAPQHNGWLQDGRPKLNFLQVRAWTFILATTPIIIIIIIIIIIQFNSIQFIYVQT